jgi:hypothetical protein
MTPTTRTFLIFNTLNELAIHAECLVSIWKAHDSQPDVHPMATTNKSLAPIFRTTAGNVIEGEGSDVRKGAFHAGRDATAIVRENFSFDPKPIRSTLYQPFVYVLRIIFLIFLEQELPVFFSVLGGFLGAFAAKPNFPGLIRFPAFTLPVSISQGDACVAGLSRVR